LKEGDKICLFNRIESFIYNKNEKRKGREKKEIEVMYRVKRTADKKIRC